MFLELAIADAYAAAFDRRSQEFVASHNNIAVNSSSDDCQDSIGYYTGITQGNIAIAKMIIQGHPWVKEYWANSLLTTYKQDPRTKYGDKLTELLRKSKDGSELIDNLDPYSNIDEPAIRAMPIGKCSTPERVFKASMVQAAMTNNHPDSLNASISVALACHYFIYNLGKKERLKDFLNIYLVTDWLQSSERFGQNLLTAKIALELVIKHHSLTQLLQHCISLNQNSDRVAAIAVATASCSLEYQQDLPQFLSDSLENKSEYGRDYLVELDKELKLNNSN